MKLKFYFFFTKLGASKIRGLNVQSLFAGMSELWREEALFDYTLITSDGKKYRTHKAFLASVSDYFKAMLCGGMLESSSDTVELKGITSTGLGPLLEFIYTGQFLPTEDTVEDILTAATHLQVTAVVELCSFFLQANLQLGNCVDISNIADLYSIQSLKDSADAFIVKNFSEIVKNGQHCKFTAKQLSHYLKSDELKCGSEFGLFNCIRQWLDFDKPSRLKNAAEMMQFVRFPLMLPSDIKEISKTSPELMRPESPCKKFLDEAVQYHKMAQNARLAMQSSQTSIRNKPSLVSFSGDVDDETSSHSFYALDDNDRWRQLPDIKQHFSNASVAVHQNYLFVCGGQRTDPGDRTISNKCYMFDPRFMTWSPIAAMKIPRFHFPLLASHGELYALGGCVSVVPSNFPYTNTNTVEKYSLKENKWEVVYNLDDATRKHAGCVLDQDMYISGGLTEGLMATNRFRRIRIRKGQFQVRNS